MSTRTIIEINHDYLDYITPADLETLILTLRGSQVAGLLNRSGGKPVTWIAGVNILAQRHHSETLHLEVK